LGVRSHCRFEQPRPPNDSRTRESVAAPAWPLARNRCQSDSDAAKSEAYHCYAMLLHKTDAVVTRSATISVFTKSTNT